MIAGGSLTGSASVRKLRTVLHAKAKEEPGRRFHALVDKVWRTDFLLAAWALVRRNGGAAGVDGVTVADIEAYGVERWIGHYNPLGSSCPHRHCKRPTTTVFTSISSCSMKAASPVGAEGGQPDVYDSVSPFCQGCLGTSSVTPIRIPRESV